VGKRGVLKVNKRWDSRYLRNASSKLEQSTALEAKRLALMIDDSGFPLKVPDHTAYFPLPWGTNRGEWPWSNTD